MTDGSFEDLRAFVRAAKARGAGDAELVALLTQHGWSERKTYAALSAYYAQEVGPIPTRGGSAENARDAFLYLLAFATLAVWAVAFVWLCSALVDRAFPTPLDGVVAGEFRHNVAGQLAALLVAFPIFILVTRNIVQLAARRPELAESGVRKWLTYLALVITSVILLGDGVWFLTQFLLGDLNVRFTLKALVIFALAGGILWYYLGSVREESVRGRDTWFAAAAALAVFGAITLGFTGIGSPVHNREASFDEERIGDLQALSGSIYMRGLKRGPASLNEIGPTFVEHGRDPVTHKPYEYSALRAPRYQLCAVFDTDSGGDGRTSFWKHHAGRQCYTLSALNEP